MSTLNSLTPQLIPPVFADETVSIGPKVDTFFKVKCIGNFVSNTVNVILIIGGIAFFVLLLLGGFQWLTSGGDKNQLEQARGRIANALIGLAILAASWATWTVVLKFFGLTGDICNPNP